MKKLILGRGEDCDVYLNDNKGLISRKHAILKIRPIGKYEITDVSKNGTFINGIRMKPHVPYNVKRKDVIVFANTSKLDWDDIPDYSKWIKIGFAGILIMLVVAICCLICLSDSSRKSDSEAVHQAMPPIEGSTELSQESSIETSEAPETSVIIQSKQDEKPIEYSRPRRKKEDIQKMSKEEKDAVKEENTEDTTLQSESQSTEKGKSPGGD